MNSYSLVISTYKREEELEELLLSLSFQNLCPEEVILINGDGVMREYHGVKSFLAPSNLNPIDCINLGLRLAHNEIIILLDDDTKVSKNNLCRRIVETFNMNPSFGIITTGEDKIMTTFHGYIVGFRKSMLEKIGYYDSTMHLYHNEQELSIRAIKGNYVIFGLSDLGISHPNNYVMQKRLSKRQLLLARNPYYIRAKHYIWGKVLISLIVSLYSEVKRRNYHPLITLLALFLGLLDIFYFMRDEDTIENEEVSSNVLGSWITNLFKRYPYI